MEENENVKNFKPREFQVEILEKAINENVIVYLPTGCGKTFIAVMLIKHYLGETKRNYSEGGKRIFFLVNTIPLVQQQAQAVRDFLPIVKVGEFTGSCGVDLWKGPRWLQEQDSYQVLTMTCQIYLDMVLHRYTDINKACLLIFDECHQAVKDHPMRKIMMEVEKFNCNSQPRILGLTATLLNANVKTDKILNEVITLERTFQASVVKALNEDMVLQYAANPKETIISYKEGISTKFSELINHYSNKVEQVINLIELPDSLNVPDEDSLPDDAILLNDPCCKSLKNIKLFLRDAVKISNELGLFAADISLLYLIVLIERYKMTSNETIYRVMCSIQSGLHLLRKKMKEFFDDFDCEKQPLKHASDKVLKLVELFKDYHCDSQAIVFVEKRSTAFSLFHIFKSLSSYNSHYKNIKCDFVVGANKKRSQIDLENTLLKENNENILKKFNTGGLNILFATYVLEEGVDIQSCNLVIKFDIPKTFRSYIQSRGRARKKYANYYIFAPLADVQNSEVNKLLDKFKAIQMKIRDVLCDDRELKEENLGEDDDDFYEFTNEFGSKITALSSISIINMYCSLLPQDKLCKLTPIWWIKEINKFGLTNYITYLRLPINSAIKKIIEGPPRKTKISAKRLVAFEACKILYRRGVFNENLRPVNNLTNLLNNVTLFPKWKEDYLNIKKCKKEREFYDKHYTQWECNSKPTTGRDVFIHVIKIAPNYSYPDTNRTQSFYNLLLSDDTFCILTTCTWPELPEFSLFMNVGEVEIKLLSNYTYIQLTEGEIEELERFQIILFTKALNILKKDVKPNEAGFHKDDYLIAPVRFVNSIYNIDWDTIRNKVTFPESKSKPYQQTLDHQVTEDVYKMKVVVPWYRSEDFNQKYVVTSVRSDQNPQSDFPSDSYKTYNDYFIHQYNQKITDKNQPLLEVRAISSKINCLLPRGQYNSSNRRKREDGNFEETLVPELCHLINFPACYLVKVTLLPSALHRIHYLLIAEELREKIVREANLGSLDALGRKWKKLKVNHQHKSNLDEESNNDKSDLINNAMIIDDGLPTISTLEQPIDLERQLYNIDLTAIIHFCKYVDRPVTSLDPLNQASVNVSIINHKVVPPLKIINGMYPGYGPEPIDILEALTSASANDIINYERSELLGDSFLKFAASLALFTFFPYMNEGALSAVKTKIIGNTNLFVCGLALNIPGLMKVNAFDFNDWKVPGFTSSPSKTLDLKDSLSDEEHLPAVIDINSAAEHNVLSNNNDNDSSDDEEFGLRKVSRDEYLMKHLVPDKVISDAMEALISVYVQNFGIEGGFKILKWMEVMPESLCDIHKLLYSTPESPLLMKDNYLMSVLQYPEKLEAVLGYTFKDKSFLLQALSHPSHPHNITDCYQRFEFLGDAILDFLLTAYIFNEYQHMNPGDMTDLRSALVNNITFACLTVRYGFHNHFVFRSFQLNEYICKFVKNQQQKNHVIDYEIFYLFEESDVNLAECIEVPKILGDIFESIIAAVYLDSGKDLNIVWSVIYNLMEGEIKKFSKNIPKTPIRMLYETFTAHQPKFGKISKKNDCVMIPLEIIYKGVQKIFYGLGENKNNAKIAAAKAALHFFKNID